MSPVDDGVDHPWSASSSVVRFRINEADLPGVGVALRRHHSGVTNVFRRVLGADG
jgi:hypothetical protein